MSSTLATTPLMGLQQGNNMLYTVKQHLIVGLSHASHEDHNT